MGKEKKESFISFQRFFWASANSLSMREIRWRDVELVKTEAQNERDAISPWTGHRPTIRIGNTQERSWPFPLLLKQNRWRHFCRLLANGKLWNLILNLGDRIEEDWLDWKEERSNALDDEEKEEEVPSV